MNRNIDQITLPLKVGVTGGIGSGKTTVCQIFEALGIPVYYSDQQAKKLMAEDGQLRKSIVKLLGPEAYLPSGALNRAHLASIVFKNRDVLQKLNALVHPAVRADAEKWHSQQRGVPYTLQEAALLVESGSYRFLHRLIVVTAPEQLRVQRVMDRDGIGEVAVRERMAQQLPEEKKVALADFVIENDGQHSLVQQVVKLHRALLELGRLAAENMRNGH